MNKFLTPMRVDKMTGEQVEQLVEALIADKRELESRGQWTRVEWIPGIAVRLEWGQIHGNGQHETRIGSRSYELVNGQLVAHTTYWV